jgi:SAM-dependent methyltransferase
VFDKPYEGLNLTHVGLERLTLSFRSCRGCGVVFMAPLSREGERVAQAWYELVYGRSAAQERPREHPVNQARYGEWLQLFEPYRHTGRLFETGFGRAEFLRCAVKAGWACAGNELSPQACEMASRFGVAAHRGDLAGVDHAGHYDVVVSLGMIEHVKDPTAQLQHYFRLLRPGGLVFLATPNVNSLSRWVLGPECRIFDIEHLFYFSPTTMRRHLRQAGFRVLGCWSRNLNVYELLNRVRPRKQSPRAVSVGQQELRTRLEFNPLLRTAKKLANAGVRIFGVGEELYAMAVKPQAASS